MANLRQVASSIGDTSVKVLGTVEGIVSIVSNTADVLNDKVDNWKQFQKQTSKHKLHIDLKEANTNNLERDLELDERIGKAISKREEVVKYKFDENGELILEKEETEPKDKIKL